MKEELFFKISENRKQEILNRKYDKNIHQKKNKKTKNQTHQMLVQAGAGMGAGGGAGGAGALHSLH